MFTGIIEEVGRIEGIAHRHNLSTLSVWANKILKEVKNGDSIAIDGVCLTVTALKNKVLFFDMMHETIDKTTLGALKVKDKVNLERALKRDDRFSGHFVTGHIDNIGVIKKIVRGENYTEFQISLPKEIKQCIVPKGSIGIDGVSLTVGKVKKDFFSVYLIPFTKQVTTLGIKKQNDKVNIEADILAKYILSSRQKSARC